MSNSTTTTTSPITPPLPNALNYTEKTVLAYSRTVTGTLSLLSSILILNKIYKCCNKKRLLSLNRTTSNHYNIAGTAGGTVLLPQRQPPYNVPVTGEQYNTIMSTVGSASTNNGQQNIVMLQQQQQRTLVMIEDDGYTPLPSSSSLPPEGSMVVEGTTSTTTTTTTITFTSQLSLLVSLLSYTTVYQRLLIGTSILDIFHSFWAALSTLPVPASSGVVGGYGTITTCSIQGFFVQFSAATPIYFAALTFYFMSKVCYQSTDMVLSKRYEIFFHVLAIIVAFGGGIIGVSLQIFNPIALPELGCWVAPYPVGCSRTNSCTRGYKIGQYSDWYAWSFAFMWFFLSFFVVLINTTMIYSTIYYRERYGPNRRRNNATPWVRFHQQPPVIHTELPTSYNSAAATMISNHSSSQHDKHNNNSNDHTSIVGSNEFDNMNENQSVDDHQRRRQQQQQQSAYDNSNIDNDNNIDDMDASEILDIPPPLHSDVVTESTTSATRTNREENSSRRYLESSSASTIPTATRDGPQQQQQRSQLSPALQAGIVSDHQPIQQHQQHPVRTSVRTSRIAAVQCVLYVSTALFTTVWSVMPWIGKKLMVTSQWRFFFAFMFNIFNPMQGFFTLIIFIRLQYLRLRVSEPNWSRLQCIRFCLFSPDAK